MREKPTFTDSQRALMEEVYRRTPYIDHQARTDIALSIGIAEEQVGLETAVTFTLSC